jgi:hypothetical protein
VQRSVDAPAFTNHAASTAICGPFAIASALPTWYDYAAKAANDARTPDATAAHGHP